MARRGEAASEAVSDEARLARHAQADCGVDDLLGQALTRENMAAAWKRVKANKGSAGVDGRWVQDRGAISSKRGPTFAEGCSTAATGLIRCAEWAYRSRVAECASWGYRP